MATRTHQGTQRDEKPARNAKTHKQIKKRRQNFRGLDRRFGKGLLMIFTGNGNDLLHSGSERRSLLPPWKSLATALGWWVEAQVKPRQVPSWHQQQSLLMRWWTQHSKAVARTLSSQADCWLGGRNFCRTFYTNADALEKKKKKTQLSLDVNIVTICLRIQSAASNTNPDKSFGPKTPHVTWSTLGFCEGFQGCDGDLSQGRHPVSSLSCSHSAPHPNAALHATGICLQFTVAPLAHARAHIHTHTSTSGSMTAHLCNSVKRMPHINIHAIHPICAIQAWPHTRQRDSAALRILQHPS